MIKIVENTIDTNEVLASVQSARAGATVVFLGTTRQFTGEKETVELNYECYQAMALKKMGSLLETARQRWPIIGGSLIHRIGRVPIGEASVAVAVSSMHRKECFEAAEWLIDTLKIEVPIWKQESYASGDQEWVHPSAGGADPDIVKNKRGASSQA